MRENLKTLWRKVCTRGVVAATALVGFTVSCVDADSLFGNTFVPPTQVLDTYIDSGMRVTTTLFDMDSVQTSLQGAIYMGQHHSDIFGNVKSTGFSTFFPYGFTEDNDTLFGISPTVDSMIAYIDFNGCVGDTGYMANISVHQIKDTVLKTYATYYSNFDPEPYYEETPIFEFTVTGADTTVEVKLPESFYSTLICNDGTDELNPYYEDSVFIEKFKGFYFKLNNEPLSSGEQGALRQLSLSSSYMTLHYHNLQNGDVEPDTTTHNYYFYNSSVYGGNNFSIFTHDYSTANTAVGGLDVNDIDSDNEVERCYIQGMGGVGAKVAFDTLYIEKLKEQTKELGYNHIGLHSAKLVWGVEAKTLGNSITSSTLERAAGRMGLYYSIGESSFIDDYQPVSELLGTGYVSDIGGYINRSTFTYEQIITSTMQNILSKPDGEYYKDNVDYNHIVQMLPAWDELLYYSETVVGGSASSDNKPLIVLVYTLVK